MGLPFVSKALSACYESSFALPYEFFDHGSLGFLDAVDTGRERQLSQSTVVEQFAE
jgi:hypothetical protein